MVRGLGTAGGRRSEEGMQVEEVGRSQEMGISQDKGGRRRRVRGQQSNGSWQRVRAGLKISVVCSF